MNVHRSPADKRHTILDLRYIETILTDFDSSGPLLKEPSWCHLVTLGEIQKIRMAPKMAFGHSGIRKSHLEAMAQMN